LEKNLSVHFRDTALLDLAVTHSSWSEGACNIEHNERLEFLGDAVLELAVSSILYDTFPNLDEGKLTKLRAWLVNNNALNETAQTLDLPTFIKTGKSIAKNHHSVNSNCLEAIFGALFLDQSFCAAKEMARKAITKKLARLNESGIIPEDSKSKLQKTCLKLWNQLPEYSTLNCPQNPDGDFTVQVFVTDGREACGNGRTKKAAEQDAARKILLTF